MGTGAIRVVSVLHNRRSVVSALHNRLSNGEKFGAVDIKIPMLILGWRSLHGSRIYSSYTRQDIAFLLLVRSPDTS